MAGLARRIAPAAALGGLAVVVVGLLDPALAGRDAQAEAAPTAQQQPEVQAQAAPAQSTQQQQQDTQQQSTQQQDAQASGQDCSNGTQVTGDSVMIPWGPVQVVGTVANGQLCEAHAVSYPTNDRKSQMINSYAIPTLDQEVSQGATQIDFVSGATFTSNAYAQSLQSILDQL
mgnify:CR=1 FL=1